MRLALLKLGVSLSLLAAAPAFGSPEAARMCAKEETSCKERCEQGKRRENAACQARCAVEAKICTKMCAAAEKHPGNLAATKRDMAGVLNRADRK